MLFLVSYTSPLFQPKNDVRGVIFGIILDVRFAFSTMVLICNSCGHRTHVPTVQNEHVFCDPKKRLSFLSGAYFCKFMPASLCKHKIVTTGTLLFTRVNTNHGGRKCRLTTIYRRSLSTGN